MDNFYGRESMQFYIAADFINHGIFVNKRIPLVIAGIEEAQMPFVRERLADLYGPSKCVIIFTDGDSSVSTVEELKGTCSNLYLASETLTESVRFDFSDLVTIMKKLRGEGGCKWDKAQTHSSIRINLIEEAYELVEAIDCNDNAMMMEETGDVLMQSVFHTEIAEEEGAFGFSDMLTTLCRKLLDRHTHIFGENRADNADEALYFWNEAKKKEKKYASTADAMNRIPKNLPALLYAEKLQKLAKKSGFDWPDVSGAYDKIAEESRELYNSDAEHRAEEAGDLLFAVVNVLRAYKIDPESALHDANRKFLRRFGELEKAVIASGKQMSDCTLEELDAVWDQIKSRENNSGGGNSKR